MKGYEVKIHDDTGRVVWQQVVHAYTQDQARQIGAEAYCVENGLVIEITLV